MAPVAPGALTAGIDKLRKGERISVRTDAGWNEGLRVVETSVASVRTERGHEPIVFARRDVLELRVRRLAPGKTAALAGAIFFFGGQIALCGSLKSDHC